ncbi:hypothetical protein CAPTEDRAFT_112775 [Capitella teleta]|uniref:Phosphofurin acidic cluster sorting protein 2 n=1 Tax=Capitella teleta TaxID=283909 RepID=R7V341_CAPTE|nr:hypothetical protein CAPTEDRAFT_112775 [Capitella teleta]|eukprot:ELU12912.1 hypothetical protein CAPTEDRAFT_112775 [Capitella teleta]
MADRSGGGRGQPGIGVKPVPMKLFATWEVEKSTPNCIPRLCSLTLTRLVIMKSLENDLQSVIIAVKMQSSKRILRSNEIIMPPSGHLDTELDLSFSLQYPHFLKRDGNKLQVMLQRRKKYKNRTILGYKTLALGQVSMAQVLQRSVDRELNLYSDPKERTNLVAQVAMSSLSSQPVDHEENGRRKIRAHPDRSPDIDVSEEEECHEYFSSNEELSDSEPIPGEEDSRRGRKLLRRPVRPAFSAGQRNIKQKFIALLKKFKVSDEVLDSEQDQDPGEGDVANANELEELFDELEDLSESDPDIDTISVLSTPKPKLRFFFSFFFFPKNLQFFFSTHSNNSARFHEEMAGKSPRLSSQLSREDPRKTPGGSPWRERDWETHVVAHRCPDPPTAREIACMNTLHQVPNDKGVVGVEVSWLGMSPLSFYPHSPLLHVLPFVPYPFLIPRRILLEQLTALFSSEENLPESLILINTNEWHGQLLAQVVQESCPNVICVSSAVDVRATISHVVNKIQKFCNSNSQAPSAVKMAIAGCDSFVNSILRPYVEQFSAKSPDWQHYVKFLVIPLGSNLLGRYLSKVDSTYNSLFNDSIWRDAFEKTENSCRPDAGKIVERINTYVSEASCSIQLPIAEAMLTYKEKSNHEESSQVFVPYINEVRIGPIDSPSSVNTPTSTSVDLEEPITTVTLSSSPPQPSQLEKVSRESNTPPNSPNVNQPLPGMQSFASTPPSTENVDLQLDYWTVQSKVAELPSLDRMTDRLQKKDSKSSLKTTFRSVQVLRLPQSISALSCASLHPLDSTSTLSMTVVTKERKQKIMRIGKKSKDLESKSQMIDGISRLICTSKAQTNPLTVNIDGVEWMGVKFFQLSPQWQTHIKLFPLLIFSADAADSAL